MKLYLEALLLTIALSIVLVTMADARRNQCSSPGIVNTYDKELYRAARRHLSEPLRSHWCLMKSLCFTESRLKPDAESGVGAIGLCQVMPGTYEDARRKEKSLRSSDIREVRSNVTASAITLQRYWDIFLARKRPNNCRLDNTLASYNGGPGNILKAQALSGDKSCWEQFRHFLRQVTGKHSVETIDYVDRVKQNWYRLRLGIPIGGL